MELLKIIIELNPSGFNFNFLFFLFLNKFFLSGATNSCPPIEIFATESKIDSLECPVYATSSSRLDPPLFNLIINEQIDQMTYIVFQNGILFLIKKKKQD
jgi:hypothetical protein